MKRSSFLNRLTEEILILDGAMGSLLQGLGLDPGRPPEELNLTRPQLIDQIHQQYIAAGADIILTNTFGGTQTKLAEYGLGKKAMEINAKAVRIAKKVARGKALVAGCIGPSGKLLRPLGPLEFDEAVDVFRQQVEALAGENPDLLVIETMSDLPEAKAAMVAARAVFDGPVIAHLTFTEGFRTLTGTDPLTALTVLYALGADVVGGNCGTGPEELLVVMEVMAAAGDIPLSVEPNAGLPRLRNGKVCYPAEPSYFAEYAERFAAAGVNLIGGCCGTTPEHIQAISQKIKRLKPKSRVPKTVTRLASRTKTVEIEESLPIVVVGERINPTGRSTLRSEIEQGKMTALRDEAVRQVEQGAQVLDLNVGAPGIDEVVTLRRAVEVVQQAVEAPLCLDSTNPEALEAALKEVVGKPLINSVTGEERSLRVVLPLAKKYGAAVIGLTLDERGVPDRAEERLQIAKKVLARAGEHGIPKEDVLVDCLTLTVGAEQERVRETLKAIRLVKENLGVKTILGVSNISHGLPARSILNSTFLTMALSHGLDVAIANPGDTGIRNAIFAANVLLNRDKSGFEYIKKYGKRSEETPPAKLAAEMPVTERIYAAVVDGNKDQILSLVQTALEEGIDPAEINATSLIRGLNEVGRRFGQRQIFLPQVMLSAETVQLAFQRLKPLLGTEHGKGNGKIVFATVKGDIHDIGKNIVIAMLENYGYQIIDLGKNVETAEIVRTAQEQAADMIALSALMTTTMAEMPKVISQLKKAGSSALTLIGGAVVTADYAREIGADGYAKDAVEAVKVVAQLLATKELSVS